MEAWRYVLVYCILMRVTTLFINGELCGSSVFMECDCQSGERDGIILNCNSFPVVKKLDEVSLQVLHILIKDELPDTVSYIIKFWPRLESLQDPEKLLYCQKGKCVNSSTKKVQILSTSKNSLTSSTIDFLEIKSMPSTEVPLDTAVNYNLTMTVTEVPLNKPTSKDTTDKHNLTITTLEVPLDTPTLQVTTVNHNLTMSTTELPLDTPTSKETTDNHNLTMPVTGVPLVTPTSKGTTVNHILTMTVTEVPLNTPTSKVTVVNHTFAMEKTVLPQMIKNSQGNNFIIKTIWIISFSLSISLNICFIIVLIFVCKKIPRHRNHDVTNGNEIEMDNI